MSKDDAALAPIRKRIDEVDAELQRLLNERAALALEVGRIKQAQPGDAPPVFYRPEREAQVLAALKARNQGPLPDEAVARLFREIISCCLSLEQPLSIAYLGPAGTYTEMAALAQFGHFAHTRPLPAIDEVFREVESGGAHFGVVPVENSTEGMVNHTLDCFMEFPRQVKICAEVELPIHHALILHPDNRGGPEAVAKILSHAQSLAQCRVWLDSHYPGVERLAVASNAEAALQVSQDPSLAAVAGETAAERYGLKVAASRIEDHPDNKTRFLVLGRQDVGPCGQDKTSILVSTKNEPGALFRVLEPFHRHDISLSRIETRPARSGDWSYVFFIDFDGHGQDSLVRQALQEVAAVALEVRSLGSYPRSLV